MEELHRYDLILLDIMMPGIDEFVEKELLLDAAETMNALSEAEKTAVSLLLKAYIGFLLLFDCSSCSGCFEGIL